MSEVCDDFLETYRHFFERFAKSVDRSDQLPVKVPSYNITQSEIPGAVGDWVLQYLEQRKCPPSLITHLVCKVMEEVWTSIKNDPIGCGYRSDISDFLSLKLMHTCVDKLIEVCARYRDNAALSTLPPPPSTSLPLVTTCAIKNCRRSMEDRLVVIHDFHGLFNIEDHGPASYYGVFDGHNGTDAAIYSVSHLHQYLAQSAYYPSQPVRALRDACIRTDELFCEKADREKLHGGTTAVFALLRPKEHKMYVAWLGDSQAVLVRQGVPLQIVRPHKPDRTDERERIESMGGAVVYWGAWRVNGQLAVSRAIGDIEYKPYVTAEPDIEEITLNGTEDFLILACDGLWDFVTEQQATKAVYQQLQENSGDLEAVSQRLVALAKEQSSEDNISVVVVFLASPEEVARRRVMETASPNPFVAVGQNGADAIFRGGVTNGVEDEDFGPETDVDMVDDVLLSPAIAAAKALVAGCHEVDDLERQRQQLADFDDPADLDPSRDTPTPPAHEVASNTNADPLAESGGEDSEEEWNYIPGKNTKVDIDTQEEEDMSSQLNPNAAEFVPVSPTKLLMMDDAIISASPRMGFEKSMDNVQVPSEIEFNSEVSRRPSDLGITNGPKAKHGDNYFMRDNFSTLRNKSPDSNSASTCAQVGDDSIISLSSSLNSSAACASEDIPFDKLEALKNIADNKQFMFGSDTDFSSNAFGVTNVLDKPDHLTTSEIEDELILSPEVEENLIPGTPKSTIVEAPVSPINEEILPLNHQTDLDSPADDYLSSPQKSSDVISESTALCQDRKTSSSGFESENGAEDGESNAEDNNEGFITEHRRSPPIDLSFKPIQTFSDTNPFGALQTPSSTTPLDQNEISHVKPEQNEVHDNTPQKFSSEGLRQDDNLSFLANTPSSFISVRQKTPLENKPVPFDELESPTEIPHFELPPQANSSMFASELPKSPEGLPSDSIEEKSTSETEHAESEIESNKSNHLHSQNFFHEENSPKYEETSFTTDIVPNKEAISSSEDLDTTAGFLTEESKILSAEKDTELVDENLAGSIDIPEESSGDLAYNDSRPIEVKPEFSVEFSSPVPELEPHLSTKDNEAELETKEMNLEFESHITNQKPITDELGHFDDGFEVISKDELKMDENISNEHVEKEVELNVIDLQSVASNETTFTQFDNNLPSPVKQQMNPFVTDEHLPTIDPFAKSEENKEEKHKSSVNNDFMKVFEDNYSTDKEDILKSQEKTEIHSSLLEPEVLKTQSYQLLTPADEPICTKTEVSLTEDKKTHIDDEIKSESEIFLLSAVKEEEKIPQEQKECLSQEIEENINLQTVPVDIHSDLISAKDESVLAKSEPVQSQVVTETLITALEETSEVPSLATTEVPSTAGTPPPTPIPTEADISDDSKKTDLLVAAVAAAGAVAVGTTLATDKAKKEVPKKPIAASKKPSDSTTKAPTKSAVAKSAAAKPTTAKTTTTKPTTMATKPAGSSAKPVGPPAKPTSSNTATKPAAAKPSSAPAAAKPASALAAAKKPVSLTKPTTAKPSSASTSKPAPAPASKTVPKHLPVNKTPTPLKSTSKPTTPTSKPTTPTAPKSPSVLKTDVKSPARPAVKSTLTTSRPSSTAKSSADESVEKKSMTNGDVKPTVKKLQDGGAKKSTLTTASKPLATARSALPASKTAPTTKAPTSAGTKPSASKPSSTVPPAKTKPSTTTATKPTVPPAIKRPTSTTAAVKSADKTGKEIANKQLSNAKAVNGKTAPAKTLNGVKKTDAKINGKTTDKLTPSKNMEEVGAENEKTAVVQEDNVTTTNGFGEHDHIIEEIGSMKIDALSPVILENVN